LARYELALEVTRRPELRQALVASGTAIRAPVAGWFAAAGVREPGQRAADFVAFLDGLLFDQIAGAGSRELTTADLRATIRALLAHATSSCPTGAGPPPAETELCGGQGECYALRKRAVGRKRLRLLVANHAGPARGTRV